MNPHRGEDEYRRDGQPLANVFRQGVQVTSALSGFCGRRPSDTQRFDAQLVDYFYFYFFFFLSSRGLLLGYLLKAGWLGGTRARAISRKAAFRGAQFDGH